LLLQQFYDVNLQHTKKGLLQKGLVYAELMKHLQLPKNDVKNHHLPQNHIQVLDFLQYLQ
jgi:hypothetical protein